MRKTLEEKKEISKEKLDWMKKIGMEKFEQPMKYRLGMNMVYSEKYIRETPLDILKAKYDKRLIKQGAHTTDDNDLDR